MIENTKNPDKVKVLIIESQKITRIGLKYALKNYNHISVVGETGCPDEVIPLIDKVKPDVVLLDLVFMGVAGIETTLKIKEKRPEIKVIVLSEPKRDEEIVASIGAGASAYCMKDTSFDVLSMVIMTVSKGAFWVDPSASATALKCFPKPKNITDLRDFKNAKISEKLTDRELEVLKLIVKGKSNVEIANILFVSIHTAKAHVCNILRKLNVEDRVQAAVKAVQEHII